jgi:hypothetical protein
MTAGADARQVLAELGGHLRLGRRARVGALVIRDRVGGQLELARGDEDRPDRSE